jgi:hypothetical protein
LIPGGLFDWSVIKRWCDLPMLGLSQDLRTLGRAILARISAKYPGCRATRKSLLRAIRRLAVPGIRWPFLPSPYIFSFIDRQILSLVVAPIRRDLHISDTQVRLLMSVSLALFYTLFGFAIGRLADSRLRCPLMCMPRGQLDLLRRKIKRAFSSVELLITPTVPGPPIMIDGVERTAHLIWCPALLRQAGKLPWP